MLLKPLWLSLAAAALAAPIGPGNAPKTEHVDVQLCPPNSDSVVVTGIRQDGVDTFFGVPFGEAPTGALRFEHPVPKKYTSPVNATVLAPVCMQENQTKYNANGFSEDCLTLNILAPAGGRMGRRGMDHENGDGHGRGRGHGHGHGESESEGEGLPVMVWIYGGGFYEGSANFYYSPTFIKHSVDMNRPVILVQINYRLGAFGFMYGRDAADNGAANLGLRDQILALQWVRDNIASFGGDPNKVTVFGQSAGAISISAHLLNTTQDLFRAAILHSGAPSVLSSGPTGSTWNSRVDQFASFAGCKAPNTTLLGSQSTWECLRTAPATTLVAANQATRYAPGNSEAYYMAVSVDGDLVPEQPIQAVRKGAFARMPIMIGNTRDEGFYSSPIGINGSYTPNQYFDLSQPEPVAQNLVDDIVKAYPNIPAMGSPFGTGNETFGQPPAYKQYAAIQSDANFQSRRRAFIRKANELDMKDTWTFEWWARANYNPPEIGVAHSSDLPYLFGRASVANNWTQAEEDAAHRMLTYWINFAHDLDPNGKSGKHGHKGDKNKDNKAPYWPAHTYPANKNMLRMHVERFEVVQDDYREDQMKVWDVPGMAEALHYRRRRGGGSGAGWE